MHLYKNFLPVIFLPYVLPFNIRIPAKFFANLSGELMIIPFLSITSPDKIFFSTGLISNSTNLFVS